MAWNLSSFPLTHKKSDMQTYAQQSLSVRDKKLPQVHVKIPFGKIGNLSSFPVAGV